MSVQSVIQEAIFFMEVPDDVDGTYLVDTACVLYRKHPTMTAEEAIECAFERTRTTARRLSHGTGAENWL